MKLGIRALVLGMLITGFAADHMLASKSVATTRTPPCGEQQRESGTDVRTGICLRPEQVTSEPQ